MSMLLMAKAMSIKVGNPLRKLVLIKLADNASDQGECWPSYQHIADQCEISKRSVMEHINALCAAGLVTKEHRKGGPKGNSSNVYHLTLGGAGDSPPPSAARSLPSAGDSLPPSAGAAPRTSHSFEPVNEPTHTPRVPSRSKVAHDPSAHPSELSQQSKKQVPFPMTLDWQPQKAGLKARAALAGLTLDRFSQKDIAGFIVHHEAKGLIKTESEWQAALVNWVKRDVAQDAATSKSVVTAFPKANQRRSNGPDFHDTSWRTMTEHDL